MSGPCAAGRGAHGTGPLFPGDELGEAIGWHGSPAFRFSRHRDAAPVRGGGATGSKGAVRGSRFIVDDRARPSAPGDRQVSELRMGSGAGQHEACDLEDRRGRSPRVAHTSGTAPSFSVYWPSRYQLAEGWGCGRRSTVDGGPREGHLQTRRRNGGDKDGAPSTPACELYARAVAAMWASKRGTRAVGCPACFRDAR